MADNSSVFDPEITATVNAIVEQYNEKKLTDKEYPLALLNAYGMMLVSQLKRQADALERAEDGIKEIRQELDTLKEIRNCLRSGNEGLSHIFQAITELEGN